MNWYNEPKTWRLEGENLIVTTDPDTDYWRVTLHDFIKDDAPFYYQEMSGDFTATVKVTGAYTALYDQAGLMVRQNELIWMKCGVEYLHDVQQASAVITREFSDWSIVPLSDNPASLWIQVKRTGTAIEVYFSRNGSDFDLIRQGYFSDSDTLQVGMMCASPKGDGFEVTFEDFTVS